MFCPTLHCSDSMLEQRGVLFMHFRCLWAGLVGLVSFSGLLPSLWAQENAPLRGLFINGTVRDDETQQPLSAVTLELQRDSGNPVLRQWNRARAESISST